jgi:hypothetical protein
MTDRELLELAAKAAGRGSQWWMESTWNGPDKEWNPLTDDADALRLAVKLRLVLFLEIPRIGIGPRMDGPEVYLDEGDDPYAATRRAIVRAAAEIGRSKT